jgi:hypothetical protein
MLKFMQLVLARKTTTIVGQVYYVER